MKATELPVNSFIQMSDGEVWSRQEGCYREVYPHCVDCAKAVIDDLERLREFEDRYAYVEEVVATDEYFTEFKVLAMPPVDIVYGAKWWMSLNTIAGEIYDGISILDDYAHVLESGREEPTLSPRRRHGV